MNLKKIFRGPLVWIILAVIAIGLLIDFSGSLTGGYKQVPTSQVVALINGNDPLSEVRMIDKEQTVQVTTKGEPQEKFEATWVGDQSGQIIDRLNQRVADKSLDSWVGENKTPGFISSRQTTHFPPSENFGIGLTTHPPQLGAAYELVLLGSEQMSS